MVRDPSRSNNFDLIRLGAAIAVVVSHSHPIGEGIGTTEPLEQLTGVSLGLVAVITFMAVSGYLVTASGRQSSIGPFLRARVLRIYPALIAVVAVLAIVGADPRFLINATGFYVVDGMRGVFIDNPYPVAVNGSLWTLGYEIAMYVVVAVAVMLGAVRIGPTLALWFPLVLIVGAAPANPIFYLPLAFLSGAVVLLARVPLRWPLALAAVGALFAGAVLDTFLMVMATAGAYLVIWAAHAPPLIRLRWDISYGTYIWAFPVQQLVAMTLGPMPWWSNAAIALPGIIVLAATSWILVERPALALKDGRQPVRRLTLRRQRQHPHLEVPEPDRTVERP